MNTIVLIIFLLVKNLLMLLVYISEEIERNAKQPKSKAGDRVRIIKYKNIFSKGYTENLSKEIFVIDSVLKPNPWTY